jgi:hypothetical protein
MNIEVGDKVKHQQGFSTGEKIVLKVCNSPCYKCVIPNGYLGNLDYVDRDENNNPTTSGRIEEPHIWTDNGWTYTRYLTLVESVSPKAIYKSRLDLIEI